MREDQLSILKMARNTYGNRNQIMVCIEELNELACVLAKYPRYDKEENAIIELTDRVLDEYADVVIVLDHVKNIVGLSDSAIQNRIDKKISRLSRWLKNGTSMQVTVDDRSVEEISCQTCAVSDYSMCKTCMSNEAIDGIKPLYRSRED